MSSRTQPGHLVVSTRSDLDAMLTRGWEIDHDECAHTDRGEECDDTSGEFTCSLGPVRWDLTRARPESEETTDQLDQARLGIATTREILAELACRMDGTQNSTKGRELGRLCREAADNLDAGVLDYATWRPHPESGDSERST